MMNFAALGLLLDTDDPVVHVVDLAASIELPDDRLADDVIAPLDHVGLDRLPVLWRRLDDADVAHPGQGHVERARDRCGRHREHVHLGTHRLEPLLVAHAEAMFLVDDDKAQVAEPDILLQHAVRADHDVDIPALDALDGLLLLGRKPEARQHLDLHGEGREALAERLVVLLREHGGRHQDRDLLAIHHRLERRA
jgi:hypothetical protein